MSEVWYFVAAYGLCFGLMNDKFPGVRRLPDLPSFIGRFFDRVFQCAFCTGFHCGWVLWGCRCLLEGAPYYDWRNAPAVLCWSFASGGFCYVLDEVAEWLEFSIGGEEDV